MPSPAAARAAVIEGARLLGIDSEVVAALELAVGELVTNAHQHGKPPVMVTIEVMAAGLSVAIADRGPGPATPIDAASVPPPTATFGRGRWLVHSSNLAVEEFWDSDGYRIRLRWQRPRSPQRGAGG